MKCDATRRARERGGAFGTFWRARANTRFRIRIDRSIDALRSIDRRSDVGWPRFRDRRKGHRATSIDQVRSIDRVRSIERVDRLNRSIAAIPAIDPVDPIRSCRSIPSIPSDRSIASIASIAFDRSSRTHPIDRTRRSRRGTSGRQGDLRRVARGIARRVHEGRPPSTHCAAGNDAWGVLSSIARAFDD